MSKCFLSYSCADSVFGNQVYDLLRSYGIDVFMAELSLSPGEKWDNRILKALDSSSHVVFLASEHSCNSQSVLLELGGALLTNKVIIPVVWDMTPSHLPNWIRSYQAVDLREQDEAAVAAKIRAVADSMSDGANDFLFAILAVLGLAYLAFGRSKTPAPTPDALGGHAPST